MDLLATQLGIRSLISALQEEKTTEMRSCAQPTIGAMFKVLTAQTLKKIPLMETFSSGESAQLSQSLLIKPSRLTQKTLLRRKNGDKSN